MSLLFFNVLDEIYFVNKRIRARSQMSIVFLQIYT